MIDIHAHYVPSEAVAAVAKDAAVGIRVIEDPAGPRLAFAGNRPLRPTFAELMDLTRRMEMMQQQGIDTQLVASWPDLFGYELLPEQGRRWSRITNEAMAAEIEGKPQFQGCATVPLQDPAGSARELRFAVKDLGFRAVMIASNVNGANLDAPELDPFWAAASELAVPVFIHPLSVAGAERLTSYRLAAILGYPFDTTIAVASLILGGVCERFPHLRFVLSHAGGFLPWGFGRLRHGYESQPEARVAAPRSPEAYLHQFYFDTIVHHPPALRYLVDWAGPGHVLAGSDYPFTIGDWRPGASVAEARLPDEAVQAVLERNARQVFGL